MTVWHISNGSMTYFEWQYDVIRLTLSCVSIVCVCVCVCVDDKDNIRSQFWNRPNLAPEFSLEFKFYQPKQIPIHRNKFRPEFSCIFVCSYEDSATLARIFAWHKPDGSHQQPRVLPRSSANFEWKCVPVISRRRWATDVPFILWIKPLLCRLYASVRVFFGRSSITSSVVVPDVPRTRTYSW